MASAVQAADFRALGTGVRVISTDPASLGAAAAAVQAELDAIDLACSRFRTDSELVALNSAGGAVRTVSPLLVEAITAAIRVADLTEGAVDPTLGSAMEGLGYDRDFTLVVSAGGDAQLVERPAVGWRRIRIDPTARTVQLPPAVHLDLGSSAKALAADRAAAAAHAATGAGILVSLGGDMAAAGEAPAEGWPVLVTDDHAAGTEAAGQVVTLRAGGLATSSTSVRRWKRGGTELHHILDPADGLPARGPWRTVSVAASTCLEANAFATAAIVWGDRAPERLQRRRLAARLVDAGGELLKLGGWPAGGERQ